MGECTFKGLIRLILEAALIMMEVYNFKKFEEIFQAGDLIHERESIILMDDERIATFLQAVKKLAKKKNLTKKRMVLDLKEIHSNHIHSDNVFDTITAQPLNYNNLKAEREELSKLRKKGRCSIRNLNHVRIEFI
jgi:hypothetical protein